MLADSTASRLLLTVSPSCKQIGVTGGTDLSCVCVCARARPLTIDSTHPSHHLSYIFSLTVSPLFNFNFDVRLVAIAADRLAGDLVGAVGLRFDHAGDGAV
jgi:hypothetical protein